jgi:hypothetical protein
MFGSCVKPGVLGNNPQIPVNPTVQDALPMQYDFRNVYGSVLMDWFGVLEKDVKSLLFSGFTKLPLISGCAATDVVEEQPTIEMNAYPNPFTSNINLSFTTQNEYVRLSLFNGIGHELKVFVNKVLPAGTHEISFDGSELTAGTYYFYLRLEKGRQKNLMLVKG